MRNPQSGSGGRALRRGFARMVSPVPVRAAARVAFPVWRQAIFAETRQRMKKIKFCSFVDFLLGFLEENVGADPVLPEIGSAGKRSGRGVHEGGNGLLGIGQEQAGGFGFAELVVCHGEEEADANHSGLGIRVVFEG